MKNWKNYALVGALVLSALAVAPRARSVYSSPVTVQNSTSSPVPGLNVNEPGDQPFRQILCTNLGVSSCAGFPSSFVVPSTTSTGAPVKRLVVEDVGGECSLLGTASATPPAVNLIGLGTTDVSEHPFLLLPNSSTGSVDNGVVQVFGRATRNYYEPGDTVELVFLYKALSLDPNSGFQCTAQLEGSFVTQ